MAEVSFVTGLIGSDWYTVTLDQTAMTGSASVMGWITSVWGAYDYSEIFNDRVQFQRLFGAGWMGFVYQGALTTCPRPVIDRVEPRSMPAGGADVTMHVYGRDFVPRSQIVFNGGLETTVFVSQLELTTIMVGATATTPGDYPVQVQTAAPGGGTSGARLFAILEP